MRRFFALLLVVAVIFIPSCGETAGEDKSDELTEWLAALGDFETETAVTAEFSDRTTAFRMKSTVAGDVCSVEVLEPATLAGIAVTIAPGGVTAEYDGASFEVGGADELGVQPVAAVAELKRLWSGATPASRGSEKRGERDCALLVYQSGGSETRVWFDSADCSPVAAEFFVDGVRKLECEFVSFTIGGS